MHNQKKYVQSNLTFWIQDNLHITDAQPENDIQLTWEQRLAQMHTISKFDDLQQYVNSNPFPEFEGVPNINMTRRRQSQS